MPVSRSSSGAALSSRTPALTVSATNTVWSPRFTVSVTRHSNQYGSATINGQPVSGPGSNSYPLILSPSPVDVRKKTLPMSSWSLPRTFTANTPVSSINRCESLSVLTPTITSGGSNEAWLSQLTPAAASSSPDLAVTTYSP